MEAIDKPKVKQFKDELNEKQLKAFEELKKKILEEVVKLIDVNDKEKYERYTEDNQVVRLLWAREFKVDKSFEMWKKWIHWRLDFKADEINEEEIQAELKSGKAFWHGKDKKNNPCLVVQVKYHRPGVSSQDVVLRYFLYLLEEGIKKCENAGTGKISVIWDRDGFDKKNFDSKLFDTFKKLNQIMQDNYAERLSTVYILHPNWFFKTVFAIVKPFLSSRTKSKITVVDKIEELKKHFDPSELLISHGGTSDYQFSYQSPEERRQIEETKKAELINNKLQDTIDNQQKQQVQSLYNDDEDKDGNEDQMTEADFNQIEETIEQELSKKTDYDINSLSFSMFQKVMDSKKV